jgi:hypothetical protein
MSIKDRKIWQRIVAICFVIMLVRYYSMLTMLDIRQLTLAEPMKLIRAVVAVFYLSNLLSIIWLLKGSRGSTIFAAVTIVFSTVFFSVSYWPFVLQAFVNQAHPATAIIYANGLMAIGLVVLYFLKTEASVNTQNPLP